MASLDALAQLIEHLEESGQVPMAWLAAHAPGGDLSRVWEASNDLDAMFASAAGVGRGVLVRAACACARTALEHLQPTDRARLQSTIELVEAWCDGAAPATAVRAAFLEIEHASSTDAGASDAAWGYARAAVAAAADAVSFELPEGAAASAARSARDAMAMHVVARSGPLDGLLLGDDPRWVRATDAATPRIAAIVRACLPCPTLAQLRETFRDA